MPEAYVASEEHRHHLSVGISRARLLHNGSTVALSILRSKWKTITAYAAHIGYSQPALSRYISGSLRCPRRVHMAVRRDFRKLRKLPVSALWPAGLVE